MPLATPPKQDTSNGTRRMSRDEAAELLLPILTDDPQSAAALARRLDMPMTRGNRSEAVHSGLRVLEAQNKAKKVPQGWVLYDSEHEAILAHPQDIEFPYKWAVLPLSSMFIDGDYQRPLTAFVQRIAAKFDPLLFGVLVLSDRGDKHRPRYAIVDGQTRWSAARSIGIQSAPCIVYQGLSVADEASMFARLQKERRGMLSYHRFRASLVAGNPESQAIDRIAKQTGYKLGAGPGEMRAVAALEYAYRIDDFLLERVLADYKEAWPDLVPEAAHIRGLHYFFRHFPLDQKKTQEIDDERLVRRLKAAGPDGLQRKANAAKEAGFYKNGATDKYMAQAIQGAYLSGGRG